MASGGITMSFDEVVRTVKANVGKTVKVYPRPHPHASTTPAILSVVDVGDEGFNCYDLSDPDLIDPTVPCWAVFSEIADVQPVEIKE
jgi:hypothetical protein